LIILKDDKLIKEKEDINDEISGSNGVALLQISRTLMKIHGNSSLSYKLNRHKTALQWFPRFWKFWCFFFSFFFSLFFTGIEV
jgi:hypothetical protein